MTRIFIPTVGSSATSANRRHSRLPLQGRPWRRSRHHHMMAGDTFETAFDTIPTQVRFSIRRQG
ncbi:hypothetical protein PQR53_38650 [Paraburkholderia fungorum]|uniref:hypothetical protein n=1 Tax=Paraburkholderia fungorum TaxID=134537 RepID=UPI0038BA3C79